MNWNDKRIEEAIEKTNKLKIEEYDELKERFKQYQNRVIRLEEIGLNLCKIIQSQYETFNWKDENLEKVIEFLNIIKVPKP